jgi:type I restriction enzyme S subunit
MDAQTFLVEFAHIANAPGGIDQLRQMIYQLAVTGALTPRSEKGEDARVLLESIGVRRQALIREKKYKRMVELEGEAIVPPFGITLPSTWSWSRLLDVGEINPRNHADEDVKAAFLPMSGVPQVHRGGLVADTAKWGDIKKGYTHFASGDVVLAKITPCFENGKAAVIEALPAGCAIGAGTTELHVFRPIHAGILPEYVYLFLRSPLFVAAGVKNMTGTAGQKRLPTDFFATRAFPLPPEEEQSRIVAKVEELMSLCDKLEVQQQARRKLQIALRQSALQGVAAATDRHEVGPSWFFLEANFHSLFPCAEEVKDIRSLIKDLAIRGLVLPKNSDVSCKRIDSLQLQSRRDDLRKKKDIRATRSVELPVGFVEPFSLPNGWAWFSLDQICYQITDGAHHTPQYVDHGVPFISVKDLTGGKIDFSSTRFVDAETHADLSKRCKPEFGDVLLTKVGTTGVARVVDTKVKFSLFVSVALLKFPHDFLEPNYLELVLSSPFVKRQSEIGTRGIGNKNLVLSTIKGFVIPLPPIEVQREILSRSKQLLEFCDLMEEKLCRAERLSRSFSSAAVSSLTGIAIESKEDASMKTPQTELIAPLRLGKPPGVKAQAPLATILARHKGEMSARDLWQRFTGEIDAFYAQLKIEVANGWILGPDVAEMREKASEDVGA